MATIVETITPEQVDVVGAMLGSHRGKFGKVTFRYCDNKANRRKGRVGMLRTLQFRQGVKNGATPLKGGKWANGHAGKPTDHLLVLATDTQKEREGLYSRVSFKIDHVVALDIGGESFHHLSD